MEAGGEKGEGEERPTLERRLEALERAVAKLQLVEEQRTLERRLAEAETRLARLQLVEERPEADAATAARARGGRQAGAPQAPVARYAVPAPYSVYGGPAPYGPYGDPWAAYRAYLLFGQCWPCPPVVDPQETFGRPEFGGLGGEP